MIAKQTSLMILENEHVIQTAEAPLLSEAGRPMEEMKVIGAWPDFTYQTIEGFGCAMTESSCYLLSRLPEEERRKALMDWFSPEGLNSGLIRVHLDSCDFSLSMYQAVEDPIADPELKTFSLGRDRKYILPVLKEILSIRNGKLSVLMSPWSPPVQWKTAPELNLNQKEVYGKVYPDIDFSKPSRCVGGRLKKEYYGPWAKYVAKYIQAYLDEGIPVTMYSVNNEENAATPWDSCLWTGEEEKDFLKNYLYPEFVRSGLNKKVGIFLWDHNKERMIEHVSDVLDEETMNMVEGIAFHWYTGDHFEAISMAHEKWPKMVLMSSECCTGWDEEKGDTVRESDIFAYAHDIIGDIHHGMQRWIDWNMMLDRKGGPRHVPGGCMATLISNGDGTYVKTSVYETMKIIMDIVVPGSVRIGSSSYTRDIEHLAVRQPDGTIAMLLLNYSTEEKKACVRMNGSIAYLMLPARSLSGVKFED